MINRELLKEAVKTKYYLAVITVFGVLTVLSAVFQAKAVTSVVDGVFLKGLSLEKIWVWMSMLLFFILAKAGLIWGNETLSKNFSAKIKHNLRGRVQDTILSAGPVRLRDEKAGEVINLAIEGVETLDAYFSEYLPQLAVAVIGPVLVLLFSFPADPVSSIIMLATAPLIPFFMILIGKHAGSLTERQWNSLSRLGGHFLDIVRGLPTMKLFGRSKTQSGVIYRMAENFRNSTMNVLKVAFLSALVLELAATLSTAIIAVTLGIRLINSQITFDRALFVLLLVPEFYQPLRQLGAKFHAGMEGSSAAKAIFRFFNEYAIPGAEDAARPCGAEPPGIITEISFSGVSFSYGNTNGPAVKDATFSIKQGECVVLTGESGSGKSTLASLLLNFIQPQEGRITVNGMDLTDIPPFSWREKIAYVPQHPYLFSGTIGENLKLGNPGAGMDEIQAAARLAGIHDFIAGLPLAYDTEIEEGGKGLSGGQKQMLSIARALLKDAPILVMDEPTSNLDYEAEELVADAVKVAMKGKLVFLITHSPYLKAAANKVLVLDNGRIAGEEVRNEIIG